MKKFIAALFLLTSFVVILLATIDLKPYLAPDEVPPTTVENMSREQSVSPANKPEEVNPVNIVQATSPQNPMYPEQKHVVTPLVAEEDEAAGSAERQQESPGLIELEVTTLPVGEYPVSILLDTFSEQAAAEQAVAFYQEQGMTAHWVKVDLGEEGIRYRVFTGIFSTIPEARQYLEEHGLAGKPIKLTYYAARIGVYTDKVQLANAFVQARESGVIPYILGTKRGEYHLYVGAFYTHTGAVDQCRDLTAAGFTCEPVKRSTIPLQ